MKEKRKPRILFIVPLPPPVHGSSMMCQYIKDSARIKGEFDCDFVNLSTSRKVSEIGKGGLWLNFKKLFRFAASYLHTLWMLLSHRYSLCYLAITCHGVGFLKDFPFVMMCKMFGNKVVIHQHNKGMANDVNKLPYKWLLPMAYRNTKVILLSWRLYDDISAVVSRDQVMICPNGIPETLTEEPKAERNNAIPHILFLSNLIPSKGVFVLLDALKILKERGYSFICDFVGGETKEIDAARFNNEVESRGLNEMAIYHGRKYGDDKKAYFEKADVFAFPTADDCFPLVLLEAMEHKIPLLASNIGGISDIVDSGSNGTLLSTKNSITSTDEFAEKLKELLDTPEMRQSMGSEGYKLFKEKFTKAAFEGKMTETLHSIITAGGGN